MPLTLNVLIRGSVPAGVTTPCGVIATTLSPTRAPSARASSAPSTMLKDPGVSVESDPRTMCLPMSATVSSCAGSTPRMRTPRFASPADSIAWPSTYGAAATTRGLRRAIWVTAAGSLSSGNPRTSIWDATLKILLRNSSWNPFITESTTISAQTPTTMPAIDVNAMNETKALRPEPLRARV